MVTQDCLRLECAKANIYVCLCPCDQSHVGIRQKWKQWHKQQIQTQQQQPGMFKAVKVQKQKQSQQQLLNTQMMIIQQQQGQLRAVMALLEKYIK